ncbi:TfoX/Sxy family protein [Pseudooceanicola aestuarii]|uniref:TfoX/Sxy family protein n=1 Tax=Pseudooceanicola aestuarii TaxID=2697319 RepID=UPI0013CFA12F|nr:TfoX/Sxy family protein [Pseudooceanicola aestuarii]
MAVAPEMVAHLRDLFAGLGRLRTGRMFSGVAFYAEDDAMFAMIAASGEVYMKSDDSTRPIFESAGARPFTYSRKTGERQVLSLMSLPDSAFEDPDEALYWARLSLPPARAAAARKRAEKARRAHRAAQRQGGTPG